MITLNLLFGYPKFFELCVIFYFTADKWAKYCDIEIKVSIFCLSVCLFVCLYASLSQQELIKR